MNIDSFELFLVAEATGVICLKEPDLMLNT